MSALSLAYLTHRLVNGPSTMTLGKHEQDVRVHAGTFLSQHMPKHKLRPPAALLRPGQDENLAKFYEDRAKKWGLSNKKLYADGRRQLRLPVGAGPGRGVARDCDFNERSQRSVRRSAPEGAGDGHRQRGGA